MSVSGVLAPGGTAKPFALTIGGRDVTGMVPLHLPVTVTESSDGSPDTMTFTVEDRTGSAFGSLLGEVVSLKDFRTVTSGRTMFGGWLVSDRSERRRTAVGRMVECTATGYDAALDWRIIPGWSSKANEPGHVRQILVDRAMVQELVNRYAGFLTATNATVSSTNVSMDVVHIVGETLRQALAKVAQAATSGGLSEPTRKFYVDGDKVLHYFRDAESAVAPYRISDGSYVRDVLATSGLVSLWVLGEPSGAFAGDAKGYDHGEAKGGVQRLVRGDGIANEPGYGALLLDGATGYVQVGAKANVHPGDTLTFECWFRRTGTLGTLQTLWSGGADDLEAGFDTNNRLVAYRQGTGSIKTTGTSYRNDGKWHHAAFTKAGAARTWYVDGEEAAGTDANDTLTASATAPRIGARTDGSRFLRGSVQMVAIYDSALTAATVRAHYRQGASIAPESLVLERDALSGREMVYVKGEVVAGSGDVRPGGAAAPNLTLRTMFGRSAGSPERQEFIDRDSRTKAKRNAYAGAFLKTNNDPIVGGTCTLVGRDGWRVGQALHITDAAHAGTLDGDVPYELVQLTTTVGLGNGTLSYDLQFGKPVWSGARHVARRGRGR